MLEGNGVDPGMSQLIVSQVIGRGFNGFFNMLAVTGQEEWAVLSRPSTLLMFLMYVVMNVVDMVVTYTNCLVAYALMTLNGVQSSSFARGGIGFFIMALEKNLFLNPVAERWLFSKDWFADPVTKKFSTR